MSVKLSAAIEAKLEHACDVHTETLQSYRDLRDNLRTLIADALDEYRNELVEAFNGRWRSGYGEMAQAYSIAADIIEDHIGRERTEGDGS